MNLLKPLNNVLQFFQVNKITADGFGEIISKISAKING